VPRPETEIVVERCLELIRDQAAPRVLDVGTGSGAIALSIAHEHPGARVVATDTSEPALELAQENAAAHGLEVTFVRADVLDGVDGPFDLVVSNPPYIEPGEIEALEPEVRDWEPRAALIDVGQTERLVADATRVLAGWLVLEVHEQHAADVAARVEAAGYRDVRITRDLAGKERVVEARWPQTT
jgi:release factor glutamine methyltransferase